jgi:oligopeptide transport system substrate-binding protein
MEMVFLYKETSMTVVSNLRVVRILTSVLFLMSVASCSRGEDPSVLRVQLSAEPVSLDPALSEDGVSMQVLGNTMEGLVGYDGSGRLQMRLAQSYQVSKDRKRYEFQLRPDAKWSDGKPVTAADFVAGIRRAVGPHSLSKLLPLLRQIKDVRDENGKLVIELSEPVGYFLEALSLNLAMPARADLLEKSQDHWLDSFPTTGPYRIAQHLIENKIILEKNPYFTRPVSIPKVEMQIVSDENTGINLFEQHELDIVSKVPPTDVSRLRQKGVLRTDPFYAVYYLAFDVKKPPFDNKVVRRVVASSINKKEIVDVLGSGERVAQSWIPVGLEGSFSDPIPGFSPRPESEITTAKKMLAKTGVIHAAFDTSSRNSMIMEKVQSDLKKELGANVDLGNQDWKSYIKSIQTDAPQIYRFGWLAPFNDPIAHFNVFTTGNPNNYSNWSDPEYDKLVDLIRTLPTGKEREDAMRKAQFILERDEAVVVPIYHYVQNHLVSPRVQNFAVNPYGVVHFDELGLKADTLGKNN